MSLPAIKILARQKSLDAIPAIIKGASERSRRLWTDTSYRAKQERRAANLRVDKSFSAKISVAIKQKFKDKKYLTKVKQARLSYWDDVDYRSARTWDKTRFITEAIIVHGGLYQYDDVDYINFKTKVAIRCRKHGLFQQLPGHHIHFANGCPQCAGEIKSSCAENEIAAWLIACQEDVVRNNSSILGGVEIDIYLPKYKLGIEYHGLYWHSYSATESSPQRYRHHFKRTLADKCDIMLIQVYENEWRDKQPIVKSIITNKFGRSTTLFARKCELVTDIDTTNFFDTNHIQGNRAAKYSIGLVYNNELVAAMTLSAHRHGGLEIIRFASSVGVVVVGGLSRILSYIQRILKPTRIFTYVDRRYGNAKSYCTAGFNHTKITPPGYGYTKNGIWYQRTCFQKHTLPSKLTKYDASLTEAENMFNNGYRRIWDAGHYCLELQ